VRGNRSVEKWSISQKTPPNLGTRPAILLQSKSRSDIDATVKMNEQYKNTRIGRSRLASLIGIFFAFRRSFNDSEIPSSFFSAASSGAALFAFKTRSPPDVK
jgi:hypothetical protein